MRKEQAKDIAIALVAISGDCFDMFAFEASDDLSATDRDKILNEIATLCSKMRERVERKYKITLAGETSKIIDSILYE